MFRILIIGFSYILPLGLGYFLGFYQCVKELDDSFFEKRWNDCD